MAVGRKSARKNGNRADSVLVEALEARTYYDLVPVVVGMPASLVATVRTNDAITVDLSNTGASTIKGAYSLELFASMDGSMADATPIVTVNRYLAPLGAGKSREIHVAMGAFPLVVDGNYSILAQVGGPLAGSGNNVSATPGKVSVVDPFVDLTASGSFSGLTSRKPNQMYMENLTVTNLGNVAAKGALDLDAGYSLSSDGSNSVTIGSATRMINIPAGKSVTLHFVEKIGEGTVPGVYYGTVNIDPNNTFAETNTSNNFAVTSNALTVLDPYPNMIGTFTGPYDFFAGVSKGTKGTLTIIVSSEDDTSGAVTGSGTSSNGADFTFTGTISTTGVVTLSGVDDGDAVTVTGHYANGKFTGPIDLPSKQDKGEFSVSE